MGKKKFSCKMVFLGFLIVFSLCCTSQSDWDRELINGVEAADPSRVEKAIKKGANPNTKDDQNETPLHKAVLKRNSEIILLLLLDNADVNAQTSNGETPLYFALDKGDFESAKILIEKGAKVNERFKNGETYLHKAASVGQDKLAELLISKGVDVDAKTEQGETPLHCAASTGRIAVAKILIESGANVNVKDNKGLTPLHKAILNRQGSVVRLLLEKGADFNLKDNEGQTPVKMAFNLMDSDALQMFIKKGIKITFPMVSSSNYPVGSPERAFAEFLVCWQKQNWSKMKNYIQITYKAGDNNPVSFIQDGLGMSIESLIGAEITKVERPNDVTAIIYATFYYRMYSSDISRMQSSAKLIKEVEPYHPSVDGVWGVNPLSIRNIFNN